MTTTTAYGATTGETYGPPLTIRYVTVDGERRYYSTQPHDGGYWVSDVARTDNGTGPSWYQTGNSPWVRSLAAARQLTADKHDPAVTRIRDGKRVRRLPGRPAIGEPVNVRLGDLLGRVDAHAAESGQSRAEAVRELVMAGLIKTYGH